MPMPIVVISDAHGERQRRARLGRARRRGGARCCRRARCAIDRRLSPRAVELRRRLWTRLVRAEAPGATARRPSSPHRCFRSGRSRRSSGSAPPPAVRPRSTRSSARCRPTSSCRCSSSSTSRRASTDGLATWLDSVDRAAGPPGGRRRAGRPRRHDRARRRAPAARQRPPPAARPADGVGGPHRPSADVLLMSLAAVAARGVVAVVLPGMGQDGAAGVAAVRKRGRRGARRALRSTRGCRACRDAAPRRPARHRWSAPSSAACSPSLTRSAVR